MINKKTNKMTNKLVALALMTLALVSCSKDKDKSEGSAKYTLITTPANTDGRTHSGYMQKIDSPDVTGTIDNSKATELTASFEGGIITYNKAVYMNYLTQSITRFTLPADGSKGTQTGTIDIKDMGFGGNIAFKDENTAYVGGSNGKILIFNPTTMTKTGMIDWSSKSRLNEVTNYPEKAGQPSQAGDPNPGKIGVESITEIIINGNYLYAAIGYLTSFATFMPATPDCNILVIDLTKVNNAASGNKDAVVKMITDKRGTLTGGWNGGGGNYDMKKTENGDIYMLCHNVFGNFRQVASTPTCVLRIKNGATDFDPSYYFDLETPAEGKGNPVITFEYYGGGKFLGAVMDPTKLTKDPYSFNADPIFRWWSFDLNTKTATKIGDEYTTAGKDGVCYFENGNAYIPIANKDSYIEKVNLSDFSKKSKTVTTTGLPHILKLN